MHICQRQNIVFYKLELNRRTKSCTLHEVNINYKHSKAHFTSSLWPVHCVPQDPQLSVAIHLTRYSSPEIELEDPIFPPIRLCTDLPSISLWLAYNFFHLTRHVTPSAPYLPLPNSGIRPQRFFSSFSNPPAWRRSCGNLWSPLLFVLFLGGKLLWLIGKIGWSSQSLWLFVFLVFDITQQ